MRAALLPTPGDPFLVGYWLRNFATWARSVDELVILVNGQQDQAAIDWIGELARSIHPNARLIGVPQRIGHDGAIRRLLGSTQADHVVLCEDDAYVRTPEKIDAAFKSIEQGRTDIVGSPRHEDYASSPLQEWPRLLTHDREELRRGLWPAFLFVRRADLLATDQRFGDRRWEVGEQVRGWRTVTPEDTAFVGIAPDHIHLDTLFGTTFQLRAQAPVIDLVHHVRLFDAGAVEEWIAEDPPWFHITGLSTLDYVTEQRWPIPDLDDHGGLWTRRMAWWLRVWHESPQDTPGHLERGELLGRFIKRTGMEATDLRAWHDRFDAWTRVAVPA